MPSSERPFRIAHLSDLHCGGPYFEVNLLERAISEINELQPDIVVCSGDLTTYGFKHEYQLARQYLDLIHCDSFVVVPGNHDARNVGYVHFEELFGDRSSVLRKDGVTIVMVEQNARRALAMSDRGYVLDLGTNRFEGKGKDLLDDPKVAELYLGGTARLD